MTKLFRHSILLMAALCLAVSCKDNAIPSDELGTDGIQQGKIAYDTVKVDIRPATGDTIDVDEAVRRGLTLSSLSGPTSITHEPFYIIGYVKGFGSNDSEESMKQYGNRFPILSNKIGNRTLQCYQLLNYRMTKFQEMNQLQIGDQIVVCGHIQNYGNTPQIAGGYLVTTDNPANPAPAPLNVTLREATGDTIDLDEAISIGFSMPSSTKDPASTSTKSYYILGYVMGFDAQDTESNFEEYGNRYPILTNKKGDLFMLCYRLKGPNNKSFSDMNQLEVGDQVVVYGQIQNRLNAPQLTQGGYLAASTNPNAFARVILRESFDEGLGVFSIVDKKAASAPVWAHIDPKNGVSGCVRATAKINGVVEEAESWLVTPVMDMSQFTRGARISLTQYYVGDKADRDNLLKILASTDGGNTWTQVETTDDIWNDGTLPQFQVVTINIDEFVSAQTQIAFAYKSTADKAFTWAIKNLTISEPPF